MTIGSLIHTLEKNLYIYGAQIIILNGTMIKKGENIHVLKALDLMYSKYFIVITW